MLNWQVSVIGFMSPSCRHLVNDKDFNLNCLSFNSLFLMFTIRREWSRGVKVFYQSFNNRSLIALCEHEIRYFNKILSKILSPLTRQISLTLVIFDRGFWFVRNILKCGEQVSDQHQPQQKSLIMWSDKSSRYFSKV